MKKCKRFLRVLFIFLSFSSCVFKTWTHQNRWYLLNDVRLTVSQLHPRWSVCCEPVTQAEARRLRSHGISTSRSLTGQGWSKSVRPCRRTKNQTFSGGHSPPSTRMVWKFTPGFSRAKASTAARVGNFRREPLRLTSSTTRRSQGFFLSSSAVAWCHPFGNLSLFMILCGLTK